MKEANFNPRTPGGVQRVWRNEKGLFRRRNRDK